MFGSSTGTFDRLVDKATSQLLLEPDWDSILAICDCIRGGDVKPKYAVGTIKKKIGNDNPHVSLFALQTLESCVKNCGSLVHEEIATKEFMEFFKDLVKKRPDPVKAKLLELVQIWSQAFRNEPSYKVVQDTFQIMKMEGYTFPALKEADAMFMAEKAPEWKDGEVCHRCRVQFSTFQRKHHCRNCGQVFCNRCSSKNSIIPKFGIEKEVRVCEACFDVLNKGAIKKEDEGDLPAEYLNSPLAKQAQTPAAGGKSEQEIAEEEELQLALALSKSEADEKEKTRQRMSLNYTPYGTTAEPPPAPVYAEPAKMATPAVIDTSDMDPELARYLNRNYWQQKQEDIKPTTSTTTTTTTPSAPIATTTEPRTSNAQEGAVEEKYQNGTSTEAENQDEEQFLNALKSSIEIFVNRMKSNSMRGRSIANDTSVQTLFMTINAMHPELMKHVQTQEESRSHYESLQDKLVQLKDAREALDALREEHREKRRREQEELERQRQIQMAHKLEILRQKKQEYLEYQRQLALQRMQEQEREMQMRLEQQKQMQQMRAMQYGSMQYPQQMYGQQMAPTFSPGGSAEGSPLHQAHAPPPSGPYAPPPQGIGMAPGAPGGQMPPVSQGYGQQFPPQAPGGYQPPGGYQAPPASYPQQGAPPPTTAGYMPPTTAQQQPPGPAGPVSMNMEFPSFSMQGMAASLPQGAPPPQPQAPPPQGQQQYVGGPQGQYAPPPAGQALPPVGQAPPPGAAMPGQDEGQQQLICFD